MFENYKVYETTLAGRPLKLETGMMAQLANAAVMATYGETKVLCTVTASAKPREGVDFFPLSVDYEEKMYSVGRLPAHSHVVRAEPAKRRYSLPAALTDRFVRSSRRICVTTARLWQPLCRSTPIARPRLRRQ